MIVLGVLALSMLPSFLAFLLEKRLVWPYVPMGSARRRRPGPDAERTDSGTTSDPDSSAESEVQIPITDYFRTINLTADRSGFKLLGAFRDGTSKLYRIRYNFWLSPDRVVLAQVGSGTLAGMPLSATWLYTRLRDGHCLLTLDDSKGRDTDLSGLTLQEVVANADFAELLARHRQRLSEAGQPAEPYSGDDALEQHRAFRSLRMDYLAEHGLARYLDPGRNAWKHTTRGAFSGTLSAHRRNLGDISRNRGRTAISRPGQAGYVPSDRRSSRWVGLLEKAQLYSWIVLGVGVALAFSRGPVTNRAQANFRLAVSAIGLTGVVGVWLLKRFIASSPEEDHVPPLSTSVATRTREDDEFEDVTREDDSPDRV